MEERREDVATTALQEKLSELLSELEPGRTDSFLIPPGKMVLYRAALKKVLPLTEVQAGSEMQKELQEELDKKIMELFPYFLEALVQGREETAESDLKAILDSIYYTRRLIPEADSGQAAEEAARKLRVMERMVLVVELQDHLDALNDMIRQMEEKQKQLNAEKEAASRELQDFQKSSPKLPDYLSVYRDSGKILDDSVLLYTGHMNRYLQARRMSMRNSLIMVKQKASRDQLRDALETINLISFGTPRLLGNVALDRLEQVVQQFREDLVKGEAEEARTEEILKDGDAIFTTMGQNVQKKIDQAISDGDDLYSSLKGADISLNTDTV